MKLHKNEAHARQNFSENMADRGADEEEVSNGRLPKWVKTEQRPVGFVDISSVLSQQ